MQIQFGGLISKIERSWHIYPKLLLVLKIKINIVIFFLSNNLNRRHKFIFHMSISFGTENIQAESKDPTQNFDHDPNKISVVHHLLSDKAAEEIQTN